MIPAVLLLACAVSFAREGGLQRAVDLLKAGDARAALSAAESEPDARARAEARVYVLHQSGDLDGALAAARTASDAYPDDAWLAQRWAMIAATLRRAGAAESAASRLQRAVERMPDAERGPWTEAARAARVEAEALRLGHSRRDAAERAARIVSFAGLGSALFALAAMALWRQRMSSTPDEVIGSNNVAGGSQ